MPVRKEGGCGWALKLLELWLNYYYGMMCSRALKDKFQSAEKNTQKCTSSFLYFHFEGHLVVIPWEICRFSLMILFFLWWY
jgi:hypothetical protein